MNRRYWLFLTTLLVAGFVSFVVFRQLTTNRIARADIVIRPYVIEQWTTAFDAKGNPVAITEKRITGIRADGTEALVSTNPGSPASGVKRRISWRSGRITSFIEGFGFKLSGYATEGELQVRNLRQMNRSGNCAAPYEKVLGNEILAGQHAIIVVKEMSDAREIAWRVPEYGCAKVKFRVERKHLDGTSVARFEVAPAYFTPGDPPLSLFAEPDLAYTEVKPSEAKRQFLFALGVDPQKCPTCFDNNWDTRADALYLSRQKPRN